MGIVQETAPGRFELTELGEFLRADSPESLKGQAMRVGDEQGMRTWGNLLHTIKTGETTFDHVHGMSGFEYFAAHPEISAGFNRAMVEGTRAATPAVLDAYDFSRFATVVDVGGGSGALIAAILDKHLSVRGILFDTSSGADYAPQLLQKAGVADRCQVVTGDFFVDALPGGHDAYVLKSIIHDWDDERSTEILKNCRQATVELGKLIIIEPVMPERVTTAERDRAVVSSDLNMLVNTGGRERTETVFRGLLAGAGFRLDAIHATEAPYPLDVIEAAPV